MDAAGRLGLNLAAEKQKNYQASLFDDTTPEWVEVDVRKVTVEHSRDFGDIWLALKLLNRLRLGEPFQQMLPAAHEKISWADQASVLIVALFFDRKTWAQLSEGYYLLRTNIRDWSGEDFILFLT